MIYLRCLRYLENHYKKLNNYNNNLGFKNILDILDKSFLGAFVLRNNFHVVHFFHTTNHEFINHYQYFFNATRN